MTKIRQEHNDEIDLFELYETLIDGKFIICAFIALATLIGFGYSQIAQPKYDVTVPFRVNVYSVLSHQICDSNNQNHPDWRSSDCLTDATLDHFFNQPDNIWKWKTKADIITHTTTSPSSVDEYDIILSNALEYMKKSLRDEAVFEIALIESFSNDHLLATDRVSTNLLNAKRVVQLIDNGPNAISFGPVSVAKSAPNLLLILFLSVVLGGMIGAYFVFARKAIKLRRDQLARVRGHTS